MRSTLFPALIPALSIAACGFSFDQSSQVKDRRILAMQVDPPELAGGMTLPPTIAAKALVVDPRTPDAEVDYEWRACMIADVAGGGGGGGGIGGGGGSSTYARCDESDPSTLIESGSKVFADLAIEVPIPGALVEALASPDKAAVAPQIQVQLRVASDAGDLYATKKITVTSVLPDGQSPNTNPELTSLTLDDIDWPADPALTLAYGACASDAQVEITDSTSHKQVRVCEHKVTPIVDDAQSEYYAGFLGDGTPELRRERLRLQWFTDQGSLKDGNTSQPDVGEPPDPNGLSTKWREPTTKVDIATLWVVVRDGRGGESWLTRRAALQ